MENSRYIQARDIALFLNSIGQNCIWIYDKSNDIDLLYAFSAFDVLTTDKGDAHALRIVGKDVSDIYLYLAQRAQSSVNNIEQSVQKYEVAQKLDLMPVCVREHSILPYIKFLTY